MDNINGNLALPLVHSSTAAVNSSSEHTAEQASRFANLLNGDASLINTASLSPQEMLGQQAGIMKTVVGVEVTAKLAGSISQSVNKLVSMT